MCHPPPALAKVVNLTAAALNPVALAANLGPLGAGRGAVAGAKSGGVKGAVAGAIGGAEGAVTDPVGTVTGIPTKDGDSTPPADAPAASDAGPTPGPAPTPTETAAMAAKRRMQALRMGLLSTITTSGAGVTSAPSLLQPTAFAAGKTALGQ